MPEFISVIDKLRDRSGSDSRALVFLADGTSRSALEWTFADVFRESRRWTAIMRAQGIGGGDRVVLAVNPGLGYVAALYGILAIGAVAVPCFPPLREKEVNRFAAVVSDAAPAAIVIDEMYRRSIDTLVGGGIATDMPVIYPERVAAAVAAIDIDVLMPCVPNDVALIQYTSGSTGTPKGVVITHGNLVSNCAALSRSMGADPARIGLSWLPPYHDMGLMGTIVLALYNGWPLVLMSPVHFVQQPYRWLKAITDYGITITVGPNFSLDLCVHELSDVEIAGLDLSTLTEFYCGAEPIRADTIRRFEQRFAPSGFDPGALIPCYGMAEATLFIAGKQQGGVWAAGPQLGETGAAAVVSCGAVDAEHTVRVVDSMAVRALDDGQIGEIWIAGPSVAQGYYRNAELTEEVFGAMLPGDDRRYLRTGDLGFLHAGELYVTGRMKDLIIVNARNIYPQDVELRAVSSDSSFRMAAAFAIQGDGTEGLAVVVESLRDTMSVHEYERLSDRLRVEIVAEFGVAPAVLHIGPRRTVPTTTSGKVRRDATRRLFLAGELPSYQLIDTVSDGIPV